MQTKGRPQPRKRWGSEWLVRVPGVDLVGMAQDQPSGSEPQELPSDSEASRLSEESGDQDSPHGELGT